MNTGSASSASQDEANRESLEPFLVRGCGPCAVSVLRGL